jgi:hypothetical protein
VKQTLSPLLRPRVKLAGLPVDLARVLQQLGLVTQPSGNRYLPDGWNVILQPIYTFTHYATPPAFYFAVLVLTWYAIVLFKGQPWMSGSAR